MKEVMAEISFKTVVKTVLFLLLLVFLYLIQDLVLVVLTAVVMASAVEPATRWFARYRVPRVPAVLIVYVVAILLFMVLLPVLVFPVLGDLIEISKTLPEKLGSINFLNFSELLAPVASLNLDGISASVQGAVGGLSRGFFQTASLIFGGFFRFILIIVISFYLAVQKGGIEDFLRIITPRRSERYIIGLWHRSQAKIGLWMQGQLLLGLIVGVIVYLVLTILGIPYALMLALLAGLFEIIPYFGPILSAVPAVLLGFSQSPTIGLMVIGFYIIIQQFENHLIYPLVVKKVVGVPPLVVILALIIGAKLAGFLGLILAAPISAVLIEILHDIEERKNLSHNNPALR